MVDVIGSHTLANVCIKIQYNGIVASCGLAQDMAFPSTVAPFIQRGVTLSGIDSVIVSYDKCLAAWDLLAHHLDGKVFDYISNTITLTECVDTANKMITGHIKGRFVVDVNQ